MYTTIERMAAVKLERLRETVIPETVDLGGEEEEYQEPEGEEIVAADDGEETTVLLGTCLAGESDNDPKSKEIKRLRERVGHLEEDVEFLHRELRLMKKKLRAMDPQGDDYQAAIEKNILRVLDEQNWRISRLVPTESSGFGRAGTVKSLFR